MMGPVFFEPIRRKASERWDQLESDPDLAAPWHQLFKQVQSPRHVLSELLQNADDAEATEAQVTLTENEFIFSHTGEDFKEEHFASLCRFGYSNKRALHTIGFRGIGFKSTFSLGDSVYLSTPTLQVAFDRRRFTEPVWFNQSRSLGDTKTYVIVPITDKHRRRDLIKNLEEWKSSPVSLLFFRHLRSLTILDHRINWKRVGEGPVPNSEWMTAEDSESGEKHLRIWSEEEMFPTEAVEEIQQERLLPSGEEMSLPPCKVEIVLGFKGRLYVVLPTGVHTELPFACNAPFVQDPARVKIKDPETSPTNRWLLARIGRLAAHTMVKWVSSSNREIERLIEAYRLLPNQDRVDNTLGGICGRLVEEEFEEYIEDKRFLLTQAGKLVHAGEAVRLPAALYEVWPGNLVTKTFSPEAEAFLHPRIDEETVASFLDWGFIEDVGADNALRVLSTSCLPKPRTWGQLLILWDFVANTFREHPHIYGYQSHGEPQIVPIQGQDELFSPAHAVRLGEKQLLQSEDDWKFLADYLIALNPNWPRFLADKKREAERTASEELTQQVDNAYWLLEKFDLSRADDLTSVVENITEGFFRREEGTLAECIQLTRILAKLNAQVPDDFQYVCRDHSLCSVNDGVLLDAYQDLDCFLSDTYLEEYAIIDDYLHRNDDTCTTEEWRTWLKSPKSRLHQFPPFEQSHIPVYGSDQAERFLAAYITNPVVSTRFKGTDFRFETWDFDEELWEYWKQQAEEDETFWSRLFERILDQGKAFWEGGSQGSKLGGYLYQVSQQNTKHLANPYPVPAPWVQEFQKLPCLNDSRGLLYKPSNIFCRTNETELLLGSEPFIPHEIDTEDNRPLFLALGIRTMPTGPDRILDQLRAHLLADPRDMSELDRLYRSLDRMCNEASTETIESVRGAFTERALVLTADELTETIGAVFIYADELDAPGVAIIHPAIRHLSLWHRLGIPERPTVDLAIRWLRSLKCSEKLASDQQNRVKALLAKYPERVWAECQHWLSIQGDWMEVGELSYSVSMQSLVPTKHLFPEVRSRIADFTKLSAELVASEPFNSLPPLSSAISEVVDRSDLSDLTTCEQQWLPVFAGFLQRITISPDVEQYRIRDLAAVLKQTTVYTTHGIEAVPYLDSAPVGTPRLLPAVWIGNELFVQNANPASMAKSITDATGRVMSHEGVKAALQLCFDRSFDFIADYMRECFELAEAPVEPEDETGTSEYAGEGSDNVPSEDQSFAPEPFAPIVDEINDDVEEEEESDSLGEVADRDDSELEMEAQDETLFPHQSSSDEPVASHQGGQQTDDTTSEEEDVSKKPTSRQPRKPPLIERYALTRGFSSNANGDYRHPDGRLLQKTFGGMFPWEVWDASGNRLFGIYPREHCLLSDPLELPSEYWMYCEKHPESILVLLVDGDGQPFELTGENIRSLTDQGIISLHAASYRLRCERPQDLANLKSENRT